MKIDRRIGEIWRLELDRNTKTVHSDSWQAVIDNLIDLDIAEASSEELSGIIFRGESAPYQLTAQEWWRFSKFAASRLGQMEHAYLAKTNNTLGESYWVALEGYLLHMICKEGYQRFWAENGALSCHLDFFKYMSENVSTCGEIAN
jgi:hypothetical protein